MWRFLFGRFTTKSLYLVRIRENTENTFFTECYVNFLNDNIFLTLFCCRLLTCSVWWTSLASLLWCHKESVNIFSWISNQQLVTGLKSVKIFNCQLKLEDMLWYPLVIDFKYISCFIPFQASFVFHIETSH